MTASDRSLVTLGDGGRALLAGQLGRALLYVAHLLAARWLGAVAYGRLAFGLNLLQLLLAMAGLGLYTAVIRYIALLLGAGKESQVRPLFLRFLLVVTMSSVLLGLFFIVGSDWWARMLGADGGKPFWLLGCALPLMAIARLVAATMNARGMAHQRMLYESLLPSSAFVVGLLALGWMGRVNLANVVAVFAASWLLSLVAGVGALRGWSALHVACEPLEIRASEVCRFAAPVWFINIQDQAARRRDVLLAGVLLSSSTLGAYSAAATITTGLGFALEAFRMAFMPAVAALHGSGRSRELKQLYREGTRVVLEGILPVCVVLLVGASYVMQLLGSQFANGAQILRVLALGEMVAFGTGAAGTLLVMSGNQLLALFLVMASNVAFVLLGFWFVPRWGVLGLALAMAVSVSSLNILRLFGVRARLHMHPYDKSYARVLLAGALALAAGLLALAFLRSVIVDQDLLSLLFIGLSVTVAFVFALWAVGLGQLEERALRRMGARLLSTRQ